MEALGESLEDFEEDIWSIDSQYPTEMVLYMWGQYREGNYTLDQILKMVETGEAL